MPQVQTPLEKHLVKQQYVVCLELLFALTVYIIFFYTYVDNLWDQDYINLIVRDWKKNPIVDFQRFNQFSEGKVKETECPKGYEVTNQGYFYGIKPGCTCSGGNYAQVDNRRCTDLMRNDGCWDIPEQEFELMPIVGGYKYCAKRDTSYNYLTVLKPTKEGENYVCKNSTMSKLCGGNSNTFQHVFCIPSTSDCPLTKISFSDNGVLQTSNDVHNGAALVELMLSEGGPPCMNYDTHYNSQTDPAKKQYELWPDIYYDGCPDVNINGKTYTSSESFEPVEGFIPTSEYSMYKFNKKGDLWEDYLSHFRAYKLDTMKLYKSNSYSKSYTKWNPTVCQTKNADGTVEVINPQVVEEMLDGPCYKVILNVELIHWLLFILIIFIIFEAFMIHMYKMEALSKKAYDIIQYSRRAASVVMQIITFICIYFIASHSNNATMKFLAANECTFDDTINESFKMVQDYLEKNASRSYIVFGLFSVILIVDLVGLVHKMQYEAAQKKDKYSKVPSSGADVELKEPITSIQ